MGLFPTVDAISAERGVAIHELLSLTGHAHLHEKAVLGLLILKNDREVKVRTLRFLHVLHAVGPVVAYLVDLLLVAVTSSVS